MDAPLVGYIPVFVFGVVSSVFLASIVIDSDMLHPCCAREISEYRAESSIQLCLMSL